VLIQDAGILRQMAEAQDTHQHIIYTLQDDLMYLANRYGKDSIAYEKTEQRLRLVIKMFKQYEAVFRAYSDGFAHLEVSNYLLNMTLEAYRNEGKESTDKKNDFPAKKGAVKEIIQKAKALSPRRKIH